MAVERRADGHLPGLALGRGRRRCDHRQRGVGHGQGIARRHCGHARRRREGTDERHDDDGAPLGRGHPVGIHAHRRSQDGHAALELHRGHQGRAVHQQQVDAGYLRGELVAARRIERAGEARHDAGKAVAGNRRVVGRRRRAAERDRHRPALAGDRRAGAQRRADHVACRIDVRSEDRGDDRRRLDHIVVVGAADIHAPGLADARASGKGEAHRSRVRGLARAARGCRRRQDRERRAEAGRYNQRIAIDPGADACRVESRRQARGDLGQRHGLADHMHMRAGTELHRHRLAGLRCAADDHGTAIVGGRAAGAIDARRDGEAGGAEDHDRITTGGRIERRVVGNQLRQGGGDLSECLAGGDDMVMVAADRHPPGLACHRDALCDSDGRGGGCRGSVGEAANDAVGDGEALEGIDARSRNADYRAAHRSGESGQQVDLRRQACGQCGKVCHHRYRDRGRHAIHRQLHRPHVADYGRAEEDKFARRGRGLLDHGAGRRRDCEDEGLAGDGALGGNQQGRAIHRRLVPRGSVDGVLQVRRNVVEVPAGGADRRGHPAGGQGDGPYVAGSHRTLEIETARYRDDSSRGDAEPGREAHARLVDDDEGTALGDGQEVA